jgi:GxxExxY protein
MSGDSAIISGKWWEIGRISPGERERATPASAPLPIFLNHRVAEMNKEIDWEVNQLTHEIIGSAIEVHRSIGPGFLETVYEEALCYELQLRNIPYVRQKPIRLKYKSIPVGESRVDLFVKELVIVELKSVDALAPIHLAQVISYLKATQTNLGLLINFNVPILRQGIKRVIST